LFKKLRKPAENEFVVFGEILKPFWRQKCFILKRFEKTKKKTKKKTKRHALLFHLSLYRVVLSLVKSCF
jgi:hypothetical protein